jgi:transposase
MAKEKYNKNFIERAEGYAQEGFTDLQIAKKLGICKQTFYSYQKKYPEFRDAILNGKIKTDDDVEQSLLKRASGYDIEEKHTEIKIINGEAKPVSIKTIKKHIPASETAIIFWLKNRRPERWRDGKHIDHSSKDGSMKPDTVIRFVKSNDTETDSE